MNKYSESFVSIANKFFTECEKIRQLPYNTIASLDGVLSTLPHIIKTKGFVYEVLTPCFDIFEYKNICYAREEDSPNEKDYFWAMDYLQDIEDPPLDMLKVLGFKGKPAEPEDIKEANIEKANSICSNHKTRFQIEERIKSDFCAESAWEWLLLSNLWMILSRDQDPNFLLCKYVFDWKECLSLVPELQKYFTESEEVIPNYEEVIRAEYIPETFKHIPWCKYLPAGQYSRIPAKDSLRSAIEFLKDKPSLLPYAEIVDEKTIDLVYYAWCSWGGLTKYRYRASLRRWGRIKIEELKEQRIFDYYFKIGYCPFKDENSRYFSFKLRPYGRWAF